MTADITAIESVLRYYIHLLTIGDSDFFLEECKLSKEQQIIIGPEIMKHLAGGFSNGFSPSTLRRLFFLVSGLPDDLRRGREGDKVFMSMLRKLDGNLFKAPKLKDIGYFIGKAENYKWGNNDEYYVVNRETFKNRNLDNTIEKELKNRQEEHRSEQVRGENNEHSDKTSGQSRPEDDEKKAVAYWECFDGRLLNTKDDIKNEFNKKHSILLERISAIEADLKATKSHMHHRWIKNAIERLHKYIDENNEEHSRELRKIESNTATIFNMLELFLRDMSGFSKKQLNDFICRNVDPFANSLKKSQTPEPDRIIYGINTKTVTEEYKNYRPKNNLPASVRKEIREMRGKFMDCVKYAIKSAGKDGITKTGLNDALGSIMTAQERDAIIETLLQIDEKLTVKITRQGAGVNPLFIPIFFYDIGDSDES
jgi:hypothetical protein